MRALMCLWYGGIWIKDLLHGKSFFVVEKIVISNIILITDKQNLSGQTRGESTGND